MESLQIFAQQCAEAIANSLDVEVTIVDGGKTRIAGTGKYKIEVGNKIPEYYVLANVIETGKSYVVDNARDNTVCKTCNKKDTCDEKGYISVPIADDNKTYGAIGLLCINEKQLNILLNKKESLFKFLKSMGDLLVSKIKEEEYVRQLKLNNRQLNTIFSSINDGLLLLNDSGMIVNCSDSIYPLTKISKEKILGKKIEEVFENIDIEYLKKNNQNSQFIEVKLKGKKDVFVSLLSDIRINNVFKGTVIVLMEDEKINPLIYKKIHDQQIFTFDDMVGECYEFRKTVEMAKRLSEVDSNILINGESGTGKELFARAIHNHRFGINSPFIAVNCAAIPESLLESELFGYEKGAFTGAKQTGKLGKFELANGGTIFLDEIGDMPLHLQVKLLRVLQERVIERIGGTYPIPINVRVIAATNKNLEKMVEKKEFRQDLYYRLNVLHLNLPSLKQRKSDIPLLIDYFMDKYCSKLDILKKRIENNALNMLVTYEWKGNIRELQNTIEYLCCISTNQLITLNDVRGKIRSYEEDRQYTKDKEIIEITPIKNLEKIEIEKALNIFGHTTEGKLKAAKALGIGKSTLYRKLKEYNIIS